MALGLQDPRGLSGEVVRALGGFEGTSCEDEVDRQHVEQQAAVVPHDDELRIEGDRGYDVAALFLTARLARGSWTPRPRPRPTPPVGWAPGTGARMAGPCR